jgi:hypothetical protein
VVMTGAVLHRPGLGRKRPKTIKLSKERVLVVAACRRLFPLVLNFACVCP